MKIILCCRIDQTDYNRPKIWTRIKVDHIDTGHSQDGTSKPNKAGAEQHEQHFLN